MEDMKWGHKVMSPSRQAEAEHLFMENLCMGCCLFQEHPDIATSNMLATKEEKSWDTNLEAN
eukprot:2927378-Prorocentrum_lima.AAC.1